jgi:hypothetical protein
MTALLWFGLGVLVGGFGLYLCVLGAQWWHDRAEMGGDRWDV